ncbi:hypothetical protein [Modestobacter italicus]|uniref:hypothetical protein n=1 Tax=Modestobacter italicus (strain DSM 44449 / CECT 9708 / BC 501) TaxID=2732864 RepID=UPI001C978409|nr:hypothetical protein [Modestobacter italicus]
MSEQHQPRPVPGPPRAPAGADRPVPAAGTSTGRVDAPGTTAVDGASPFADLAARPVAEHVAVFEAEHDRLQRELSTVDQL